MKISYFHTSWDWVEIAWTEAGLYRLKFLPCVPLSGRTKEKFPALEKDIKKYLRGEKVDFRVYTVDFGDCTPFQRKVLEAVRNIPYGETRSYSWISSQISHPRACRAVGTVLKMNRLPLIIPCHRVIRKDGSPGRFSWGEEKKIELLQLERRKSGKGRKGTRKGDASIFIDN